jgi:hypothetical protein
MKKKNGKTTDLNENDNTDDEKDNSFLKIKNNNSELTKEIKKLTKNLSNKRVVNYKGFINNNNSNNNNNNNEISNSLNKSKITKESLKNKNSNSDIENSDNEPKNTESDISSDNHSADKRKRRKKQVNKYDFII